MNIRMSTVLSTVTALLVVFLAGSAFVLSYDALRALAGANGFANWRQYLWPLTLDAIVIVAILSVIRCHLARESSLLAWVLVILFTFASTAFNIVHAPDKPLAQIIASLPPIVVFLGLELLSAQLRSFIRQQDRAYAKAHKEKEAENTTGALELTRDTGVTLPIACDVRTRQAQVAVDTLLAFYATNPTATQVQAGVAVSRSRQWVSNKLAELEKQGIILRNNGEGVVVSALRGG